MDSSGLQLLFFGFILDFLLPFTLSWIFNWNFPSTSILSPTCPCAHPWFIYFSMANISPIFNFLWVAWSYGCPAVMWRIFLCFYFYFFERVWGSVISFRMFLWLAKVSPLLLKKKEKEKGVWYDRRQDQNLGLEETWVRFMALPFAHHVTGNATGKCSLSPLLGLNTTFTLTVYFFP